MQRLMDREVILEQLLCYRALILAIMGKDEQADVIRWFLRRKKDEPTILKSSTKG